MNMDEQKQTYEQFKADILQWKDAHREEYTRFAKMMADGNEMQYLAVCRAIFKQLPGIRREWQQSWCDDSTDGFRNIGLHFKENAVPGQIVELYRKQREEDAAPPPSTFWGRMKYIFRQSLRKRCVTLSAPLVLSWLYYGKSFEAMVDMVSRQAGHPKAGNAERMGCSIVVKQIIEVSIKNGFRTQEDWDKQRTGRVAVIPIPKITRQKRQTPVTARHHRHSGRQERRRYRSGRLQIISSAETRRQLYNASAVSSP